jgi:peptidoglycan/LPS O-acetylase OafA/YrhL
MKFGYWTEWMGKGPGIADKVKTYFCQVPLFLFLGLTIIIFMMKYHVSNPVSRFFGKYSLHTYLMNLAALTALRFLQNADSPIKAGKYNLLVYALGVILLSVLLGVGEQKLTELLQKLLFKKKDKKAVS